MTFLLNAVIGSAKKELQLKVIRVINLLNLSDLKKFVYNMIICIDGSTEKGTSQPLQISFAILNPPEKKEKKI